MSEQVKKNKNTQNHETNNSSKMMPEQSMMKESVAPIDAEQTRLNAKQTKSKETVAQINSEQLNQQETMEQINSKQLNQQETMAQINSKQLNQQEIMAQIEVEQLRQKNSVAQIEVEQLDVAYDNHYIIKNMDLCIPKGKITMIIGSNGCGKSTLLKTVARIIKPSHGTIKINGKNIKEQAPKDIAKEMAVLPQSPKAPSGLLIRELVSYGRFPYQSAMSGMTEHDIEIVNWALEVTNMTEFADKSVDEVSGGQRQRAWIAMALAQETDILVLDEPTTYLDMSHQLEILLLLQKLNREQNRTIVMVLHELNNATRFADHIIGVKSGSIVFEGHPKDVITENNLETLYGIKAKLQMDETDSYPICVDFDLAR